MPTDQGLITNYSDFHNNEIMNYLGLGLGEQKFKLTAVISFYLLIAFCLCTRYPVDIHHGYPNEH